MMAILLLSKGADANAKDNYYLKSTILLFIKDIEKLKWKNSYKDKTPLHYALTKFPNLIELLISKGADINAKTTGSSSFFSYRTDIPGQTPLHMAIGNLEIAKLLLRKGANINARDIIYQNMILLL